MFNFDLIREAPSGVEIKKALITDNVIIIIKNHERLKLEIRLEVKIYVMWLTLQFIE